MSEYLPQEPVRVLRLEGGCNFRDIGGYRTASGREVRWGRVFRAGTLSYMSEADLSVLHRLELRAICDLRRADERTREPTTWRADRTQALQWDNASDPISLSKLVGQRPATPEGMFDAMQELYRGLPSRMSTQLRGLLNCIAQERTPLVVHCSAGKDRTGFVIASLLRALDVPLATIIEDYVLTNEVGNFELFIRDRKDAQLGLADAHHPLMSMAPDLRRVLFSAHEAFLLAAFDTIDTEFGGFDPYLRDTIGIDPDVRQRLQQQLLS